MAALRQIKRRIKTAKNISQVTRAMEMVSAVKMRKLQLAALAGRPYITELETMVSALAKQQHQEESNLYLTQPARINKIAILVIAPQKGLCGALITNLSRSLFKFTQTQTAEISFINFEKKAQEITRHFGKPVLANFNHPQKNPSPASIRPVASYLTQMFENHEVDQVLIAYTHFINTVTQKPTIKQFLPILPGNLTTESANLQILFEPSASEVLHDLILRYCEDLLYQIILESLAAEHSARMVAMKNAHDNAAEIIDDLTLFYNKARQEAITAELATGLKWQEK